MFPVDPAQTPVADGLPLLWDVAVADPWVWLVPVLLWVVAPVVLLLAVVAGLVWWSRRRPDDEPAVETPGDGDYLTELLSGRRSVEETVPLRPGGERR